MITNADIEQAFLQENLKVNEGINKVQFEFYKKDIERSMKMFAEIAKNTVIRPKADDSNRNPFSGKGG